MNVVAELNNLSAGQHTIIAGMRSARGGADTGLRRTFVTLTSNAASPDGKSQATFFVGTTRAGPSDPSSQRLFAYAAGELMFRSSGSSNYGSNYPGFWFPSVRAQATLPLGACCSVFFEYLLVLAGRDLPSVVLAAAT